MWFLEHPTTNDQNSYDGLSYSIKVAYKQVAEKNISDAAARLRGRKKTADIGVSVDGTKQRKRFLQKLHKYEKITPADVARYETLKLPLIIPVLHLEWKQQEIL